MYSISWSFSHMVEYHIAWHNVGLMLGHRGTMLVYCWATVKTSCVRRLCVCSGDGRCDISLIVPTSHLDLTFSTLQPHSLLPCCDGHPHFTFMPLEHPAYCNGVQIPLVNFRTGHMDDFSPFNRTFHPYGPECKRRFNFFFRDIWIMIQECVYMYIWIYGIAYLLIKNSRNWSKC